MNFKIISLFCVLMAHMAIVAMDEAKIVKIKEYSFDDRYLETVIHTKRDQNNCFYSDQKEICDKHFFIKEKLEQMRFYNTQICRLDRQELQKMENIESTRNIFSHYMSYSYSMGVSMLGSLSSLWGISHNETKKQISLVDTYAFDWEKPYSVPIRAVLKCGDKNFLQTTIESEKNIQIYDIELCEKMCDRSFVCDAQWMDNNSCCCLIQKNPKHSTYGLAYMYDIENNKHFQFDCDVSRYGCGGSQKSVWFATIMENGLYMSHIRPYATTRLVGEDGYAIKDFYICGHMLWVSYKNQQQKELLIAYDMGAGCKEIQRFASKEPFEHILDPYGSHGNKQRIVFMCGDELRIYNAVRAELVYTNKQFRCGVCAGIWSDDGLFYVLSPLGIDSKHIIIHNLEENCSRQLKLTNNETAVVDRGFQGNYVLATLNKKEKVAIFNAKTGGLVLEAQAKGKMLDYGFCARNYIYSICDQEVVVYDFINNKTEVSVKHDNQIYAISSLTSSDVQFFGCVVCKDYNQLMLINFMKKSVKELLYRDVIHGAWFNTAGDRLMLSHGKKVEIIDTLSGDILTTLQLDEYVDDGSKNVLTYASISPDNQLCVVCLADKKTVLVCDIHDEARIMKALTYPDEVQDISFDVKTTRIVVATAQETHVYYANLLLTN
jgi:hypothetical protein